MHTFSRSPFRDHGYSSFPTWLCYSFIPLLPSRYPLLFPVAPTRPPGSVRATIVDPTSVTISWNNIPLAFRNGVVRRYTVRIEALETGTQSDFSRSRSPVTLIALHPAYNYRITVAGFTVALGPFSSPVSLQMPEARKSPTLFYREPCLSYICIFYGIPV